MTPKEHILNLKSGETWIWPESDYGKAEIFRYRDVFVLSEIPMYGGEPRYAGMFLLNGIDLLINRVESWT